MGSGRVDSCATPARGRVGAAQRATLELLRQLQCSGTVGVTVGDTVGVTAALWRRLVDVQRLVWASTYSGIIAS